MQPGRAIARGLLAVVLAVSLGCQDISTAGPTDSTFPRPGTPVGSPPPFPVVPNASAIYVGPYDLYDRFTVYHGSSLPSRYVLFSDSTFYLQTASYRFGVVTYPGRYVRTDTTFNFSWTVGGGPPWDAVGVVQEVTLHIRYSLNMQMADFLDGPYVLIR